MVLAITGLLWVVSYLGIWLFSFAHSYILWLIKQFVAISDEMLGKIDVRLKWAAGVLTSVAFLAKKLMP